MGACSQIGCGGVGTVERTSHRQPERYRLARGGQAASRHRSWSMVAEPEVPVFGCPSGSGSAFCGRATPMSMKQPFPSNVNTEYLSCRGRGTEDESRTRERYHRKHGIVALNPNSDSYILFPAAIKPPPLRSRPASIRGEGRGPRPLAPGSPLIKNIKRVLGRNNASPLLHPSNHKW